MQLNDKMLNNPHNMYMYCFITRYIISVDLHKIKSKHMNKSSQEKGSRVLILGLVKYENTKI